MKRSCLILLVLFVFAFGTSIWSQCPEDPNDPGECDTLYVEPWPEDTLLEGDSPWFVRVPIYVTNDVPDPDSDQICAFAIPLCFTSTNAAAKCVIDSLRNSFTDWPSAATDPNCLFRDLPGEPNIMANTYQWEIVAIKIDSLDHIWIGGFPYFRPCIDAGTHALLATLTFTVWDTTTICIDTCFWPPLTFVQFIYGPEGIIGIPRSGTGTNSFEVCFNVQPSPFVCGDVNGDGVVDLGDVVYLISYIFRGGPPPDPSEAGDVNCDGPVDLADVVYLIIYLYRGGPPPCE